MKVTKYVHSCLLVEEQETAVLLDPGNYAEGVLNVGQLQKLDYLLITHEHPDHFSLLLVKQVAERFPNIRIVSNASVVSLLAKENLQAESSGTQDVTLEESFHERIFLGQTPQNTAFHVFGRLTHPGDSLSFSQSKEILALPIQAPWGSTTWAVEKALEAKPKTIIPIHDWHWREEAKKRMYERLEHYFAQKGIQFFGLDAGSTVEI